VTRSGINCSIAITRSSGKSSNVTGGLEIDTAGDGFLTMFDGAARAVQSALEIRAAVRGIGLDIRVGGAHRRG